MARVNWGGTEIEAQLVEQLPNGNYKMRALGRAPRVEPGTIIEVKQGEIVGLNIGNVTFLGPGAQPGAALGGMPAPGPAAQASPVILTKADLPAMAALQSNPQAPTVIPPKGTPMGTPLVEIKGLGNAVTSVRSGLAGVRALAADVQTSVGNLTAELADMKAQIEDARTQIKTEASILGNSPST